MFMGKEPISLFTVLYSFYILGVISLCGLIGKLGQGNL